jgi:hypothetical protein
MQERYFRIQSADEDPERLLDPDGQRSEPWDGTVYMANRRGKLDDALLVMLEGEPTGDEDFDADEGALLITPTRIVDVRKPDRPTLRKVDV